MKRLAFLVCAVLILSAFMALPVCAQEPAAAFGRECSAKYAAYGEWVTLRYTVRNTLDESITAVTVSDPLVGEVGYAAQLEMGKSIVFTARVRIMADCLSSPSLSYECGGEAYTLTASQEQIVLEAAVLSAALSEETREGTNYLVLTVSNEGNSPLYGVKADDQILGDMGASWPVLQIGQSARFERPVSDEQTHLCRVSAVSAGGQTLWTASNEYQTSINAEYSSAEDGGVELSAYAQGESLFVVIDNRSAQQIEEAVLREQESDSVRMLRFLPAHEKTEVLWTDDVSSEKNDSVIFELVLPDGRVISAEPVKRIETDRSALMPEAAVPSGLSFRLDDDSQAYRDMMIGAGLVLAVLIAALWLTGALRRRRERRRRVKKRQEMRKKQRAVRRNNIQKSEENIP